MGCEGVEPCDDYDYCCQQHNICVDESAAGAADDACHSQLLVCLNKALDQGAATWIDKGSSATDDARTDCDAETVVNSLTEATELAILFSTHDTLEAERKRMAEEQASNFVESMDEATWREEVRYGRQRYNPDVDAAFHRARLQAGVRARATKEFRVMVRVR